MRYPTYYIPNHDEHVIVINQDAKTALLGKMSSERFMTYKAHGVIPDIIITTASYDDTLFARAFLWEKKYDIDIDEAEIAKLLLVAL